MSVAWKRRRWRQWRKGKSTRTEIGRRKGERGAACSSKHIKCGILNAKLSTTTTTTTRRIGCRNVVAPSCCRQTLDGDTLRVIELSEMLSPSPSPIANSVAIAVAHCRCRCFRLNLARRIDKLLLPPAAPCSSALQEQIFNSTRKGCQRMQCSRVRCLVCRLCRALSMAQATSLWPTYFYNIQFNLVSAGCAAAKARCVCGGAGGEYGIECSSE